MFERIKKMFGSEPPSKPPLRNKPGGMARLVNMRSCVPGMGELDGCVVTTVTLTVHGLWAIAPHLPYTPTNSFVDARGVLVEGGMKARLFALADEHLIPIGNPGAHEQDETLKWLPVPSTPVKQKESA